MCEEWQRIDGASCSSSESNDLAPRPKNWGTSKSASTLNQKSIIIPVRTIYSTVDYCRIFWGKIFRSRTTRLSTGHSEILWPSCSPGRPQGPGHIGIHCCPLHGKQDSEKILEILGGVYYILLQGVLLWVLISRLFTRKRRDGATPQRRIFVSNGFPKTLHHYTYPCLRPGFLFCSTALWVHFMILRTGPYSVDTHNGHWLSFEAPHMVRIWILHHLNII